MYNKENLYHIIAITGEVLVLVGAAAWITRWTGVYYIYAFGATLFAIGRFSVDYKYTMPSSGLARRKVSDLVLRRLYRQRIFGNVVLLLSALVMNMPVGFYSGVFISASSWLVFFAIFVVFELYTAFRIPQVMDKKE
ncbi:MAG: hypothetical protein NC206_02655 [Bacteroides sp.]|nr:hypothetical protein [Roseburia sp.]MCM1345964.1 hypothetical protein [Bacteroides sp.]MCM1420901.1 hypothetical protein [Bacteroides sp.]